MLQSFQQGYFNVVEVLDNAKKDAWMPSAAKELLDEVVDFLKPFKDATEMLSASERPTLHLVVPIISKLKDHCNSSSDYPSVEIIKAAVEIQIDSKIKLDMRHKIACFLCPTFRSLRMLPDNERKNTISEIRRRVASSKESSVTPSPADKPTKRLKTSFDFSDFSDPALDYSQDEIKLYQSAPLAERDYAEYEVDPMLFWSRNQGRCPALTSLALRILCIPATSVPSERVFFRANFIVSERRNRLKPEKVNNIMFLHSNLGV